MSTENINLFTIAFEGPHRVGKEVRIQLLNEYLQKKDIPSVVLRGDGSRQGANKSPGDPQSRYWQKLSMELHDPGVSKNLWNYASYVLSSEFLIWKKVYMPRMLEKQQKRKGVIILDRSILSRTLIPREMVNPIYWKDTIPGLLYKRPENWKGEEIQIDSVAPDLIFNLTAPLKVLLSRLDENDQKYYFRKNNLLKRYNWYIDSIDFIPERFLSRIVTVDTNKPEEQAFAEIKTVVDNRLGLYES